MSNIFMISSKYKELLDKIEELDGEITPEIGEQLTITEAELEEKIKSYHGIISSLKGDVNVIDDEVKRLKSLAGVKENLAVRLTSYVKDALLAFGIDGKSGNKKLEFDTLKLWSVNKDKLVLDPSMEDGKYFNPPYTYVTLKLPIDMEIAQDVYDLIKSKGVDMEDVKELNPEVVSIIRNKKISDALKIGKSVGAAKLVNNPYIVMK